MSEFVKEILQDIYSNKDSWKKHPGGIIKDDICIDGYGNSAILSIVCVAVNHTEIPLSYMDRYRLEKAISWWYKNVSLKTLTNS